MNTGKIYIVGAGISGIGAGYYAAKNNIPFTILERGSRVGGRAGSEVVNDSVFEYGGKNYNIKGKRTKELLENYNFAEFDDQHPFFPYIVGKKVYILGKGKKIFRAVFDIIRTSGITGASQFGNFMGFTARHKHDLRYLSDFVFDLEKRYDDKKVTEHIKPGLAKGALRLFPILFSGLEPDEIAYSTLALHLADQSGQYVSIQGGAHILFNRILEGKEVKLNTEVEKIVIENNKVTGLLVREGGESKKIAADRVVAAVPLYRLKDMFDLPAEIVSAIDSVIYSPLTLVVAKYKQDVFNKKYGSLFFSDAYHLGHCAANRAYQKNIIRYTFSGRRGRTVMDREDAALIDLAEQELGSIRKVTTGIPLAPNREYYKVYRYKQGVCGFKPHYSRTLRTIREYFGKYQGLELTGDYMNGPSVEMCLYSAQTAINRFIKLN